VTVTLLDGIVLARASFNHSINYRSAVLFGRGRLIADDAEKLRALARFTERLLPGRWADARQPSRRELKATAVVAMPLDSAAAKVRSGPPQDDAEDLALPVWAGVLPIHQVIGDPLADPALSPDVPLPSYLGEYVDQRRAR
jgi:hypothetical protein